MGAALGVSPQSRADLVFRRSNVTAAAAWARAKIAKRPLDAHVWAWLDGIEAINDGDWTLDERRAVIAVFRGRDPLANSEEQQP